MKIFKKFFLIHFLIFTTISFIFSQDQTNDSQSKFYKIIPDHIVDITIDAGAGLYVGNFYKHLADDGAYVLTPVMDIYISIFIIKYFGAEVLVGSGSVIHPYSEPIEGTIIYMGIGLFFQYEWKYAYIKLFTNAGFQHTTMLLQWYASGYFESGFGFGIKITNWMYITSAIKYRMGFLNSIIIQEKYNLDYYDTIASMNFTAGFSFRIKNPYKNKN